MSYNYSTPGAADSPGRSSLAALRQAVGHNSRNWAVDFAATESARRTPRGSEELRGRVQHYLQVVLMPVLGAISDSKGRRQFLILGAFGLFVQFVLCGMAAKDVFSEDRPDVAPYVGFGPACLVLISSMIQGGTSTFLATVVSMVADVHQRSGGGAGPRGWPVSGLAGETR